MTHSAPEVLFDENQIRVRVDELARRISEDFAEAEELQLIGILKGAFIFLADLSRRLEMPRRVDFVALSSYGDTTHSGAVRLLLDLKRDIAGKHVLVVDDIMDTGATLQYLTKMLRTRKPASLRTCVLVRKEKQRKADVEVNYVGFEIPDIWVVGYGLDWADRFRTLPHIAVVRPVES